MGILAEQGTGKTLPTLCLILEKFQQREAENALIVCPLAVIGSWERDIEKFFSNEEQELLRSHITVINYDMVWRRKEYYENNWDIVVCDESHYIKSRTSKRAKAVLKISTRAKFRYILTGTVIANGKLHEIYSQFAFLAPFAYGRGGQFIGCEWLGTWKKFCDRYCLLNRYYQPYKYLHVDELQELIEEHSYRVLKKDCLDLPEKLPPETWNVQLAEKKLYGSLHKNSIAEEFDLITENPLARLSKLRQVASGFINSDDGVTHELECNKPQLLKEFLEYHEGKLVIFAEFKHSIDCICEALTKLKIKHITLDGRQKDKSIWRAFQTDTTVRVIVAQYTSGNAGIDLYTANTMLFYEPTLSSTVLSQAQDRIHRVGQHSPCSYIRFSTQGTVEPAIWKALDGFNDFSEALFAEYMETYTKGKY